jgi:hypothetical protein
MEVSSRREGEGGAGGFERATANSKASASPGGYAQFLFLGFSFLSRLKKPISKIPLTGRRESRERRPHRGDFYTYSHSHAAAFITQREQQVEWRALKFQVRMQATSCNTTRAIHSGEEFANAMYGKQLVAMHKKSRVRIPSGGGALVVLGSLHPIEGRRCLRGCGLQVTTKSGLQKVVTQSLGSRSKRP